MLMAFLFLGPGSIYDFYFLKQGSGHWYMWTEYITKEDERIPANAKVKEGWPWSLVSKMAPLLRGESRAALCVRILKHSLRTGPVCARSLEAELLTPPSPLAPSTTTEQRRMLP